MSDFTPAVLLAGEEHLLRLEAAEAQRVEWRAQGFEERLVFHVESRFDWNELSASFYAVSLFAQRRIIDVRLPTGKPGKVGAKVIADFCADPPAETALLVTADVWGKRYEAAWSKAIAKVGRVQVFWPVKHRDLPSWVAQRLRSRGLPTDSTLIDVLVSRSEGNLLALSQSIDKLVLLLETTEGVPSSDQLLALVADQSHFDVFGLCDALLARQLDRAIRAMQCLRAEGERVAGVLPMISSTLLELDAAVRGEPVNTWPARKRQIQQAARRLDRTRMTTVMAQLAKVERISKGRGFGGEWRDLERLIWLVAGDRPPMPEQTIMDGRLAGLVG